MSMLALPQYLLDSWSVCETLRRFGFSNEEIIVGFGQVTGVGEHVLYVRLNTQDVEFISCAALVPEGTKEGVLSEWERVNEAVVSSDDDELTIALSRSMMGNYARVILLAAELVARGIIIPNLPVAEQGSLSILGSRAIIFSPGGSA